MMINLLSNENDCNILLAIQNPSSANVGLKLFVSETNPYCDMTFLKVVIPAVEDLQAGIVD